MSNLIQSQELHSLLGSPELVIVDTRFSLQDKAYGSREFTASHLPGAIFLDLEADLSGPHAAHGGRHPLPSPEAFAVTLGRAGIGNNSRVVVYDDAGNMFAVRLWWMLRWLGHRQVQILDGGLQAWQEAGYETSDEYKALPETDFVPDIQPEMLLSMEQVKARLEQPGRLLVDSRAADRYRGENETLDPKAGHIPGALNRPFKDNLAGQRFKTPAELKADFQALGLDSDADVAFYCGSGVTACHNLLAMEEAGFALPKLYAGSWSDWSSYENNPIA